VFGLLVDLNLWVIRAEVALAASLRLARLCLGEAMTRMTGAAASGAAVWIDAPDAGIGPSRRIELAAGQWCASRQPAGGVGCASSVAEAD